MPVCRGTKHSRGTFTPACVLRTPAVKNYIIGTVVKPLSLTIYIVYGVYCFTQKALN